jgi:hypothetical protein
MNQIFFGHGRYGVQEAARFYFGKDVKDVTVGEAAMLAGLPQSPNNISPLVNPERAKVRQTYVLNELARHGKITAAEAKKWIDAPIEVVREPFPHLGDAPEWVEVARAELEKKYGKGGYGQLGGVVRTTLRPQLQAAARAALQAALRAVDARHKVGRPVRKVKPDKVADELARLGKKLPAGGPAKGESLRGDRDRGPRRRRRARASISAAGRRWSCWAAPTTSATTRRAPAARARSRASGSRSATWCGSRASGRSGAEPPKAKHGDPGWWRSRRAPRARSW